MPVKEYMTKHKAIRLNILQSKYPNILDENTSVSIALNCENEHTSFRAVERVTQVSDLPTQTTEIGLVPTR